MKKYTPQSTLDDFLNDNELNSQLYRVLLELQDGSHLRKKLTLDIILIFSIIYKICNTINSEKHPEQYVPNYWEDLILKYENYEASIILSAAYIVLALEGGPNEYLSHCLQRIKTKIDDNYFEPFESILHSANAYAEDRTLPADFAYLKKRADKIDDLNERELYYQEHVTRYKQAQNTGDIITQIDSEVELIKTQKGLIAPTESVETKYNEDSDIPDKLKTVVYIELFRLMEKGKNINDISAMARFISFMTGQSYKKLYKQMLEEIRLTSYHAEAVKKMNDYFQALNISISIEINKQY